MERPMNPVDVVYQSGLGYIEPDDPAIAGVGMKGSRLPRVMRMSQPLPRRTLYRISHVPAPKPSDYAHVYVNDYAQRIENPRLETCYHPNLEMNRPKYVFRPRSPVREKPCIHRNLFYDDNQPQSARGPRSPRSPRRYTRVDPLVMTLRPENGATERAYEIAEPRMNKTFSGRRMPPLLTEAEE